MASSMIKKLLPSLSSMQLQGSQKHYFEYGRLYSLFTKYISAIAQFLVLDFKSFTTLEL
jgi:hypothetical protein